MTTILHQIKNIDKEIQKNKRKKQKEKEKQKEEEEEKSVLKKTNNWNFKFTSVAQQ